MADFLSSQIAAFPEQQGHYTEIRLFFQRKLWHQLTAKLLEMTKVDFFLQGDHLTQLYTNVVSKCKDELRPLALVQIATAVAKTHASPADAVAVLADVAKTVSGHVEASTLCSLQIILVKLKRQKETGDELKDDIDACLAAINGYPGIMEADVYAAYYLAALEYHRAKGPAADFYQNALSYMSYTSFESLELKEQVTLVSDIGLAALVGTTTFGFGDVLTMRTRALTAEEWAKRKEQPPYVLSVLDGTDKQWLRDLLVAFNKGDLAAYGKIAAEQKDNSVINQNKALLDQKIRIMALIEMVFRRPAHDRVLSFADISSTCQLPEEQVELLLMKSFSLKVLRGKIDQVKRTVQITWVQPRVLNDSQMQVMKEKLSEWGAKVEQTANYVQQNAPEILQRAS